MTNIETQNNSPTHIAYQVKEVAKKSYWTRIGVAFAHKDGNGFNVILDAVPLDGNVSLRIVTESK